MPISLCQIDTIVPIWHNIIVGHRKMEINNLRAIRQFQTKHPDSRAALERWITITKAAVWKRIIDVQCSFPSAEDVKGWAVFNIKGNDFRLITSIAYFEQEVNVHEILTHQQYNRWKP